MVTSTCWACSFTYLSTHLHIYLYYRSMYPSILLFIYPSIHPSIDPCIHPSILLSIHPSISLMSFLIPYSFPKSLQSKYSVTALREDQTYPADPGDTLCSIMVYFGLLYYALLYYTMISCNHATTTIIIIIHRERLRLVEAYGRVRGLSTAADGSLLLLLLHHPTTTTTTQHISA